MQKEILSKIKSELEIKFPKRNGGMSIYAISNATGLSDCSIKLAFEEKRKPTFDTVARLAECAGLSLFVN